MKNTPMKKLNKWNSIVTGFAFRVTKLTEWTNQETYNIFNGEMPTAPVAAEPTYLSTTLTGRFAHFMPATKSNGFH